MQMLGKRFRRGEIQPRYQVAPHIMTPEEVEYMATHLALISGDSDERERYWHLVWLEMEAKVSTDNVSKYWRAVGMEGGREERGRRDGN